MTYRARTADLITGGALTRARGLRDLDRMDLDMWKRRAAQYGTEAFHSKEDALAYHRYWQEAETALRAIIANDTPGSNATVKRMVRIAKEALEP